MKRRALIVFAKEPQAGKVKTRLCPPFTHEQACDLYGAFLSDAFEQYNRLSETINMDVLAYVAPDKTFFHEFKRHANVTGLFEQTGNDLGEKMRRAFEEVFGQGYHQAVVIGTDHPTLPDALIHAAFEQLDKHDGVIGPASDGGYYLLGIKKSRHEYFDGIAWSSDSVFETTKHRFEIMNERCCVLPEWYDVDDAASLERMINEMADRPDGTIPKYTYAFLQKIGMTLKFLERT